jgi:two-component system, NarL family, nitrate/nitrite response regulator NarL
VSFSDDRATIRVLIIAAVRLYREGLADALGRKSPLTVVGAFADGHEAMARIAELAPHVVLLDMTLPHSRSTVREFGKTVPNIPLVAIGLGDSESETIACAEAGITGFMTRDASLEDLIAVIETSSRGEVTCSPQVAGALVRRLAALAATHQIRMHDSHSPLTRREREVASLLERDLTNKEIASRLGIEVATVKNHVHNVLEKLSVRRRSEAAQLLNRTRRAVAGAPLHDRER